MNKIIRKELLKQCKLESKDANADETKPQYFYFTEKGYSFIIIFQKEGVEK